MSERRFDGGVRVALVVCLSFLLTSTGWLSWLYHLMELDATLPADVISMVAGYALQALGVGSYALLRKRGLLPKARILFSAVALGYLALLVPSLLGGIGAALASGLLSNVLCGAIQGFYFCLIAEQVPSERRGTVFGVAYAASTLLSWLLTLPAGGHLTKGLPCLLLCLALAVATSILVAGLPDASPGDADQVEGEGRLDSLAGVVPLACAVVLIASVVKTIGFSFPAADVSHGMSIELSRLLYGVGLVAAGLLADRDRRLGFYLCVATLAMPFLMLALASAGVTGTALWLLAYFLTGFYSVFRVLLMVDLSARSGRDHAHVAVYGLLFGRLGEAAGTGLYLGLNGAPVTLIVLSSAFFMVAMWLIFGLYTRLYPHVTDAASVQEGSQERDEREAFEDFAQRYGLTARERDVLRLVLEEKSNPEIAGELVVSEATVKYHVGNLLKKTGCKKRLDVLAAYARQER